MRVVVGVAPEAEQRPPPGSQVVVQVRDTSYQDAAATVVAEATAEVSGDASDRIATVDVDVPADRVPDLTVWAHVRVDPSPQVSPGDFITTASYPVREPDAGEPLEVQVKPV